MSTFGKSWSLISRCVCDHRFYLHGFKVVSSIYLVDVYCVPGTLLCVGNAALIMPNKLHSQRLQFTMGMSREESSGQGEQPVLRP